MPNFDTIAPGKTPIAAYQTILELGRGGMGTVSLARAVGAGGFERLVVVKRLNRDLLGQEEATRRFLDEARHAALIHHANVVGIHQIGRDGEGYFLVLDYVEGTSLDGLVDRAARRGERIPPPIVLRVGLDALAGLHAAHQAADATGRPLGLLHRDVSLQNVLVGRDGVSRIADFGIAKSALASVVTDHRYMVGKLMYSPPEYLWRRPVGPPLDVYALGVTLWIAFASTDPFPDLEEAQLVTHILNSRIPRLGEIGIRIAPQVDALVAKACDPAPERRYQSAQEMATAMEAISRETGWLATHGEVATYVEELIGSELRARRDQVARFVEEERKAAPVHESVAPPPMVMEPTRPRKRPEAREAAGPVEVPVNRGRTGTIAVLAGGAALLGAGALWLTRSGAKSEYAPVVAASTNASAAPPKWPALATSPTPSAAPSNLATPSAAPVAVDPSTLPKEAPVRASKKTVATESPKPTPPVTPHGLDLVPEPAPRPPESPSSGGLIRKSNPYR
ncbi:MAG TPA: protein kinase [Polyangiaceae bacterium]|nr:protein kinase [Polyangiaceae bacterium]